MDASSFWMSDEPTTCWAWLTAQNNPSLSYTLFHYLKWAALAPPTFSWLAAPHHRTFCYASPALMTLLWLTLVSHLIFSVVFSSDCLQILCFISCCFIVFYIIAIVSPWAPQVVRLQLQYTWWVLYQVSCRDAFFILKLSVAVTVIGAPKGDECAVWALFWVVWLSDQRELLLAQVCDSFEIMVSFHNQERPKKCKQSTDPKTKYGCF